MLINGIQYHVEMQGTGTPLVLLHGFTGSAQNWRQHVEVFSKQFTVLALDLPGHGSTDAPEDPSRYHVERCTEDLITIFDHFRFERVNLLGYSMGGRLAFYTAATYPDRINRLILESASPGLETEAERQARIQSDEALAERIKREGIEAFVDYWENIPLFASQSAEIRTYLRSQRLLNDPYGLANSLLGMGTGVQPSLWDALDQVQIPVLLLAGELDPKFTAIARRMHGLLPNSKIQVIKNAGHTPHLEQPGVFQTHVLNFLAV